MVYWDKVTDLQDTGSIYKVVDGRDVETLPTNISAWCYKDGFAYLMRGYITWEKPK